MDRGHNDDYNNGLEGRIRTILHFANENERYLHWRSSLTSLTPARIRVHARAIMCMNYILYMTHTQRYKIGLLLLILTHFWVPPGTKNVTQEMKHSLHTGGKKTPYSVHVPSVIASPVKPFGRFLRQTTDASTLHPYVPALKVIYRQTVCCWTSATNDRWFSRP